MSQGTAVDPAALREEVKHKYREVAINPGAEYHFHTSRPLARRLGYDETLVDAMPEAAISNGVINLCADKKQAFSEIWRILRPGAPCSLPTSPTASRYRRPHSATSTSGLPELPVVFRVKPGER